MEFDDNLIYAFILTTLAGLSTGIGGLAAFSKHARKSKYLAFGLGLAAGAMIYISFVELIFGALETFKGNYEEESEAYLRVTLYFIGGLVIIGFLGVIISWIADRFNISKENLAEIGTKKLDSDKSKSLYKTGIITAFALAVHNLPEGLVTFLTTIQDINLGIGISIAIAIHNIPEGLAVALPIYYATKSKKKALLITLAAGLSEPIGAGIAYFLFFENADPEVFDVVNVFVASIMVYVAFFELLPQAYKTGHQSHSKWGLIAGFGIMGISIALLA
ncbi:Metal transporter, ZIP family [Indibacter alkaliphilus LW1]|uniref:Metal transporter, ZIP family n=1 Tax=Indibacter alkaliphilus (strain CCUG 57479 / KCTC 22604 / LW1) TaxID=1189612 RepID=S2E0L6_INDAL|nr:zinc transporter ZupT [Indibacter alkaliphilus]EOZ95588.1 Metal transporter, ZIP family [Indibacter alkaliphilus LW1]